MDGKIRLKVFLFIVFHTEIYILACSPKSGVYRYGNNCAFTCNCKNTAEQCDVTTGECPVSGCADGWIGPGCRFADISLHSKNTRHSDNLRNYKYASRALNGNPDSCSMTDDSATDTGRFWRVWLTVGTRQIVRGAFIRTLKSKTGFYQGFKFFVDVADGQNAHNIIEEQLCHEQATISSIESPLIEIFCDNGTLTGNQMRFVLSTNGAQLVLCDVHVYGECQNNVCGQRCDKACHCQEPVTADDKLSGICSSGCTGRWTSTNGTDGFCDLECSSDTYGVGCSSSCSGNCKNDGLHCDHINGSCPDGCEAGWIGSTCGQGCNNGKYGYGCESTCGHCQDNAVCNKVNGDCPRGRCEPGWKESKCNKPCANGKYGVGCTSTCGHCQDNAVCNKTNGVCPSGLCKSGWEGLTCDKPCANGNHGVGCTSSCGHCQDNVVCNKTNDVCPGGLCKPGWEDGQCSCANGKYGVGCTSSCGRCQNNAVCNKTNGVCPDGLCDPGWEGLTCDQYCSSGKYGSRCSKNCSGHCKNDLYNCHHINGSCPDGCDAGWVGSTCDQACANGKYGVGCTSSCGRCQNNAVCNKTNGVCPGGLCDPGWEGLTCDLYCSSGKYGSRCSKNCSGHCKNDLYNCHHINGSCPDGCDAGWVGSTCDQACVDGNYGIGCAGTCGQCQNNAVCNKTNGICPHELCVPGWEESTCGKPCSSGKYGERCSRNCSGNCEIDSYDCNHINGSCPDGCQAGWEGSTCDQACQPGQWGAKCVNQCGYCWNGMCDAVTGFCFDGCSAGYQNTTLCDQECSDYSYGLNCKFKCNENCGDDGSCSKSTGLCLFGCIPGYTGNFCDRVCDPHFYGKDCRDNCSGHCVNGEPCEPVSGNCTRGCQPHYTGDRCDTQSEVPQQQKEQSDVSMAGAIIGGVIGPVIVIATVVVVVVVLLRRRKRLKDSKEGDSDLTTNFSNMSYADPYGDGTMYTEQNQTNNLYANIGSDALVRTNSSMGINSQRMTGDDHEPTEYANTTNAVLPIGTISLDDFGKYIQGKPMAEFQEEFERLPFGAKFSTNEALKPENRVKNRYKDLYPSESQKHDETRVKLAIKDGISGSDYINATYIDGFDLRQAYVAAQGPTEKNINDFWRMVSELKIQKIVMVTNCFEEGKTKCVKYWPDDHELFGSVNVTTISEEIFADFTVRTLEVREENESSQHIVTQYHYTSWPDHGTPDNISSLVHFWQRVRKGEETRKQTWLVHCSAGVGRTGTFIGLDYLYDEGKANNHVNIYRCVEAMREQRINMVQRKEQYKFLHEVVYEALCSTSEPIPCEEFQTVYHHLQIRDTTTNKTGLRLEYEKMCRWTFHYSESQNNTSEDNKDEFSLAKDEDNVGKNRDPTIIPADDYIPFLTTEVPGCTSYINAVYMPMYGTSRGFIVTQNPLPTTVVDYYRLLYEKNPSVIVSFSDEASVEDIVPKKGEVLTTGPFSVELMEESETPSFKMRTVQYTFKQNLSAANTLTEYIFTQWNEEKKIPSDAEVFFSLLAEIQRIHMKDNTRPIVVTCLNGATKSGLFCFLWNVLERMRIDGEVAIPQTIRNLRHRRPQIIPNFDQFSFCYDAILTHLQSSDIYANV